MRTSNPSSSVRVVTAFALLAIIAGCSSSSSSEEVATSSADAVTGQTIAGLALANVGRGACSTNSDGGAYFDSSCTGNGGLPEFWCADFARWVWGAAGINTGGLTAAAGSFYVYGQSHGTLSFTPHVGDAVVFDYHGGGSADHVAIVTQVNGNGTIETVSGDWGGQSGSEAHFSSTSHVVLNAPAYGAGAGSSPGIMGMTISGYISPSGVSQGGVGSNGCTVDQTNGAAHFGCACVDGAANGGFCPGTGCTAQATGDAAHFGCACVDGVASGGYCSGSGCTALETENAAKFGCQCVDHNAAGGFCGGSGCTALETQNAAKFGCQCVDHNASGGFCNGTGCTALETEDAAKFGCQCVDHQASGGYCDGTGCTALETQDAAKFGCGCVDHKGAGGACTGTGCTARETNDCANYGAKCSMHSCVK